MTIEVRMPAYSESMEEADVVGWLVAPGDRVSEGDPIAEIETDKATGELESPASGILSQILVSAGSQGVKVGELLALIEPEATETTDPSAPIELAAGSGLDSTANLAATSEVDSETNSAEAAAGQGDPIADSPTPLQSTGAPVRQDPASRSNDPSAAASATALARRLADRAGLDLASISGSGASGRILKVDVEAVSSGGPLADSAFREVAPPQLQLRVECRADRAKAACERLSALEPEAPIPFLALIVRAAAGALREVPETNLAWVAGELVQLEEITLALGLLSSRRQDRVLLRDADRKSLAVLREELGADTAESPERAEPRTGPTSAATITAGVAAISILDVGNEDVDSIQPFAAPPGVCVLGTGALTERPVDENGELAVGLVLSCTLAVDARAIDAESAARLLSAFRHRIEDPLEMILD